MMDRWILPVGADWATIAPTDAIKGWERRSGFRLPDDYRTFMMRYDGGRPYPLMFLHTARESDGEPNPTEHYVDPFFEWEYVSSWTEELGNRLPKGCLAIGGDPGLINLILSLRQDDYGCVYSWVRNWGAWSSPENDYLCLQAQSFQGFVESLFENEQMEGYDYWYLPSSKRTQRPLTF